MLTDFYSECAEGFARRLAEICQREANEHEILSHISTIKLAHGRIMTSTDIEGTSRYSEMKPLEAHFEFPTSVIEKGDRDAFRQSVNTGIVKLRDASLKLMFSSVSDICDETGNSIDLGGNPLTVDGVCQLFEMIEIPFDKNGQPEMPTIIVPPDQKDQVREFLDDPVVQSRIEKIIRDKWLDRYTLWNLVRDTP